MGSVVVPLHCVVVIHLIAVSWWPGMKGQLEDVFTYTLSVGMRVKLIYKVSSLTSCANAKKYQTLVVLSYREFDWSKT